MSDALLREALEFYADIENWKHREAAEGVVIETAHAGIHFKADTGKALPLALKDHGETARAALAQEAPGEDKLQKAFDALGDAKDVMMSIRRCLEGHGLGDLRDRLRIANNNIARVRSELIEDRSEGSGEGGGEDQRADADELDTSAPRLGLAERGDHDQQPVDDGRPAGNVAESHGSPTGHCAADRAPAPTDGDEEGPHTDECPNPECRNGWLNIESLQTMSPNAKPCPDCNPNGTGKKAQEPNELSRPEGGDPRPQLEERDAARLPGTVQPSTTEVADGARPASDVDKVGSPGSVGSAHNAGARDNSAVSASVEEAWRKFCEKWRIPDWLISGTKTAFLAGHESGWQAHALQGWRPIEEAPKDGTPVDLFGTRNGNPSRFPDAVWAEEHWGTEPNGKWRWHHRSWDVYGKFEYTHYRPLPTPPEEER